MDENTIITPSKFGKMLPRVLVQFFVKSESNLKVWFVFNVRLIGCIVVADVNFESLNRKFVRRIQILYYIIPSHE